MLKLYFSPNSRVVRIAWLLEELGLPYELKRVEFVKKANTIFAQATPTGKIPTITDGSVVIGESSAIVEYILERYGHGRLSPDRSSDAWPTYLQWLHFAESTAFSQLSTVIFLARRNADMAGDSTLPNLLTDAKARAAQTFDYLEKALDDKHFLLGDDFTAADIMMGFTLTAGNLLGVIDETHPRINSYIARLQTRPSLQKVNAIV